MIEDIKVELARELLLGKVETLEPEKVDIEESLDRILYEDFKSEVNIPNFRKSALDGFALDFADTQDIEDEPKAFKIHGYIEAGNLQKNGHEKNTAVKIMTGASVPDGYNTVIKKEIVEEKDGYVYISQKLKDKANVVQIGEDVKTGDVIAEKGIVVNPGMVGVMASLGTEKVEVVRKPRVGILNTGKEILPVGKPLSEGQIYNSNYYTLASILRRMGCIPVNMGIATDDIDEIADTIDEYVDSVDIVLTTGGASVGDYDFIYDVYRRLDAEVIFKRVDMKPGTPMLSAYYKEKLLIGLSGNPGAAFVSFDYLITPVINKLRGKADWEPKKVKARLKTDFIKKSPRRRLVRARFEIGEKENYVFIPKNQKSGTLQSMTVSNCLIDVMPPSDGLKAGEEVEVILLEGGDLR